MANKRLPRQNQAEKDEALVESFYDAGFLKKILNDNYPIIAGRKGAGKTAIAKFLQEKYGEYDMSGALRIPVTSFTAEKSQSSTAYIRDRILLFVLLKTAKYLYEHKSLNEKSHNYWQAVFEDVGLSNTTNYENFKTTARNNYFGFNAILTGQIKETREINKPKINTDSVLQSLLDSFEKPVTRNGYLIFIDDLSDYIDPADESNMMTDIEVIKEVLFGLDSYNTYFKDVDKKLSFITCIRDDLFEFMKGSNINKLKTNTLFLSWNEKDMLRLIIKRLDYFSDKLDIAIENPEKYIRNLFPDNIFQERLSNFNTKRSQTNFYAYMVAISFNRPRDFLAFCYALKDRLSPNNPATIDNIDSAEIQYTDYFVNELKDEIFIASKVFSFGTNIGVEKIVDILASKNGFGPKQIRTELAVLLGENTRLGKQRIEDFIYRLWWYGILGFQEKRNLLINFRYMNSSPYITDQANEYIHYLHRGLWWFTKKRKQKSIS